MELLIPLIVLFIAWYYRSKKTKIILPPRLPDLPDQVDDVSGRRSQPRFQALAPDIPKTSSSSDLLTQSGESSGYAGATQTTETFHEPPKRPRRPTLHLPAAKSQKGAVGPRQNRGERVVILDLETTGLSPGQGARIIEIAACEIIDGELGDTFVTFVNPGTEIPFEITNLTGIDSSMTRKAPRIEQVSERFLQFVATSPLVGHNVSFDLRFCRSQMGLADETLALCTLRLARRLYPGHNSYRLGPISQILGIAAPVRLHRAAADTSQTAHLFRRIRADAAARLGSDRIDIQALATLQRLETKKVDNWFTKNMTTAASSAEL